MLDRARGAAHSCRMVAPDLLRVVVVDDMRINQLGTKATLEAIDGVAVVATYDFSGALERDSWDDVDWVITDVAYELSWEEPTPAVPLVERIRNLSTGSKPMVVAVTSNPIAYNEPVIKRRLVEADADIGLVWRVDLDAHLRTLISGADLDAKLRGLPLVDAPSDIPELGISHDTEVNRAVEGARKLVHGLKGKRNERWTWRERDRLARDTGLEPVRKDGISPFNSETPGLPQLSRLVERADVPPEDPDPAGPKRRKRR